MKKYILGIIIVILLSISGYFIYQNYFPKTEYYISYYELTEKDINELRTYGEIDQIKKEKIKTKEYTTNGAIYIYIRGNEEKQKKIITKIQQNKHVREIFEPFNDITVD